MATATLLLLACLAALPCTRLRAQGDTRRPRRIPQLLGKEQLLKLQLGMGPQLQLLALTCRRLRLALAVDPVSRPATQQLPPLVLVLHLGALLPAAMALEPVLLLPQARWAAVRGRPSCRPASDRRRCQLKQVQQRVPTLTREQLQRASSSRSAASDLAQHAWPPRAGSPWQPVQRWRTLCRVLQTMLVCIKLALVLAPALQQWQRPVAVLLHRQQV